MKRYLALAICLLSFAAYAGQKAVTDDGKIVILNSNGTWQYEDAGTIKKSDIKINKAAFKKNQKSIFRLKSTNNKSEFWIDPKEWTFNKGGDGSPAEYKFQRKGKDLYAMAITEKIQIDMPDLAQLALKNAKSAAPDARIVKEEYRTVNGHKVIYLEMLGTIRGIKFEYLGYYYSDASGSTQYMTFTGANLVSMYRNDIDKFLNGFSVQ